MLEALFLGLVQGLTEFIPVSSSAHIRIVGELPLPQSLKLAQSWRYCSTLEKTS